MIAVIDSGMGNVGSVANMLGRIGAKACIASNTDDILKADKLILPGVGAFDRAVESLQESGFIPAITEKVLEAETPILGICLGMQLLSRGSEEGCLPGLGWIDAETVRFKFEEEYSEFKLPHMGWNSIDVCRASPLLDGLEQGSRFYFVHSYHVRCADESSVLAVSRYGVQFHSAIMNGHVMGTQFHPEKSHKFGMRLLSNFAKM